MVQPWRLLLFTILTVQITLKIDHTQSYFLKDREYDEKLLQC